MNQPFDPRDYDYVPPGEPSSIWRNGHAIVARAQKRFELIPFDKIALDTTPAYLVKGIIPRVGLCVFWGPPKCGKSFLVFDLMMHVALGWKFRGRRVRQGSVVYCALEGCVVEGGMMARILRKLRITEISACDRPAQQGALAVIMKRAVEIEGDAKQDYVRPASPDHIGPEHARLHSMATDMMRARPGMSRARAVANIYEANASFRERVKREFLAHALANTGTQQEVTKMVIDFKKMAPNEDSIALEKLLGEGKIDLTKTEIHGLIEKRARELREDGETLPQAYAKFITEDPAGRVLFKAYQAAVGHRV